MNIKPLSTIADKWSGNASRSGAAYTAGVKNPKTSWQSATAAADESRKAGLAAADARNAFVEGVNAAGDATWQKGAVEKGPTRFAQGVQIAKPAYTEGFSKFHGVISSTTLPPRGPKGSPENITRVTAVTEALHKAKVA